MASEQFSINISKKTKDKLEEMAQMTGCSKESLANEMFDEYLDYEAWSIKAVQEGIRAVEEGRTVPMEEIEKEWGLK